MPQYKYKAQTYEGEKKNGQLAAADETELQQILRGEGLFMLSASLAERKKMERPLNDKVLAEFSRQLGTLVAAGVTLVRALNIISNAESIKPREKRIYEEMLRQIRQGRALSEAMEDANGAFPPLIVYMYRSAESSGNLDHVAIKMAEHYEKGHRLNTKISTSMMYPKILAVMIVAVVLILTKFVMPQLQELFDQMPSLPLPTQILNVISNFLQEYWVLAIILILGAWVGARGLMRIRKVRIWWHKCKLHMPLVGILWKTIYTSRFAGTLSSLYSAGVPIVSALQIARKTIGNDYIDVQFDDVIPFVRAGNNLSDGLDMIDGFMKKLPDSIRVGEETGSLDSMLTSTSNAMEYGADVAITKMVGYVEPMMLIIMGAIVAFVMIAVFSALYGSYDAIAGM